MKFSLSRFAIRPGHFEVWVEFVVPVPEGVLAGTTELLLPFHGEPEHVHTIGLLHPVISRRLDELGNRMS